MVASCNRRYWLQPPPRTAAASIPYGCSLHYLRLQPLLPTVAGVGSSSSVAAFERMKDKVEQMEAEADVSTAAC